MPRPRPLTVLLLLAGSAIGTPAAAQPSTLPEIRLYSNVLAWTVAREGRVRAELWSGDTLVGTGQADAASSGTVRVPLFVGGVPGRSAVIRPGHRLLLTGPDGSAQVPAVPLLAADVDATRRVAGLLSPPGTGRAGRLALRRADGTVVVDRAVAGGAQPQMLDLSDADIRPGDRGEFTWHDDAVGAFILPVGVFSTTLRWDLDRIDGVATAGNLVSVGIEDSAGTAKGGGDTTVLFSPSWATALALTSPLAAGDRVILRADDRLVPGAPADVTVTLPPLTLNVDLGAGQVRGSGPAGAVLDLSVRPPNKPLVTRAVVVDAAGRFALTLPAGQLAPGSWVALDHLAAPGITVRREVVAARLRVALDTQRLSIDGQPEALARFSVQHRRDGQTYDATAKISDDGRGLVELPVDVESGDTIRYSLDDGPVGQLVVPALTATVDTHVQALTGVTLAGAAVEAAIFGSDAVIPSIFATTDASGRYRLSLPPEWGLAPGANGVVRMATAGAEIIRLWGAVRLDAELGSPYVSGNPGSGREAKLDLLDASGQSKATGGTALSWERLDPFGGLALGWWIALRGSDGLPMPLAPGDRLVVDADGTRKELMLPTVDVDVVDQGGDRVAGRTLPGAPVEIAVERQVASRVMARGSGAVTAGADGRFEHVFQDFDLRAGDTIITTVTTPGGHRVRRKRIADWLYLRLDNGVLTGEVAPLSAITGSLLRGGTEVAQARGASDSGGAFTMAFQDTSGARVLPREGDVVVVDYPGRPPGTPLQIDVHDLTLDWDLASDTIRGSAQPDAELALSYEIVTTTSMGRGVLATVAGGDGGWSVDFYAQRDRHLIPGMRIEAMELLPSGHRIGRQRYIPQLDLQLDGPRVAGRGDALAEVEIALLDASNAILGEAAGTSGDDGRFDLALADAVGRPVALGTGHAVKVTIGGQARVMRLPVLDVQVTWEPRTVMEIQAAPDQMVDLWTRPGCRPGEENSPEQSLSLRANSSGQLVNGSRQPAQPGSRIEFGVTPEPGWRFYRHAIRPLLVLEHGEAEVAGCAPPLTVVAVALRDGSGNLRGSGTTTAGAAGGYHVRLTDPTGAPVTVAPGDVAELTATGDQPVVRAEPLWLRREPDGTLTGGGAPDREIVLVFEFAEGRRASHSLRSGPEGEFRFTRADLPLEADWSPVLAERVRAYMATDNDHFIGVAAVAAPRKLFLPLCHLIVRRTTLTSTSQELGS